VRRALAVVLAVGGLALTPAAAAGAALTLDDTARAEAVRAGEKSLQQDAFDAEWKVRNSAGDTATVLTPFHRLVVAARHAAFNSKALRRNDVEKTVRETRDRLVVWVELRGAGEGFARHYRPRLVVGDREIKPAFVQNERTAARQEDGRYLARCVYGFPTRDLDGRARAALVVADGDGREVSRFAIDLGKMR
jgi:hypothetical protein